MLLPQLYIPLTPDNTWWRSCTVTSPSSPQRCLLKPFSSLITPFQIVIRGGRSDKRLIGALSETNLCSDGFMRHFNTAGNTRRRTTYELSQDQLVKTSSNFLSVRDRWKCVWFRGPTASLLNLTKTQPTGCGSADWSKLSTGKLAALGTTRLIVATTAWATKNQLIQPGVTEKTEYLTHATSIRNVHFVNLTIATNLRQGHKTLSCSQEAKHQS